MTQLHCCVWCGAARGCSKRFELDGLIQNSLISALAPESWGDYLHALPSPPLSLPQVRSLKSLRRCARARTAVQLDQVGNAYAYCSCNQPGVAASQHVVLSLPPSLFLSLIMSPSSFPIIQLCVSAKATGAGGGGTAHSEGASLEKGGSSGDVGGGGSGKQRERKRRHSGDSGSGSDTSG